MNDTALHHIIDAAAYWVFFWTVINILLPPREIFSTASDKTKARYEIVLKLVAHYGALNVRQAAMQLYSAVKTQAAPPQDPPQQ